MNAKRISTRVVWKYYSEKSIEGFLKKENNPAAIHIALNSINVNIYLENYSCDILFSYYLI